MRANPIQPLTDEQRRLVEDNYGLVFDALKKSGKNIEDYHGVAAIGLCKAAIGYDDSRNIKFSTYAFRAIQLEIKKEIVKENLQMRNPKLTQSLDEIVADGIPLSEIIGSDESIDDGLHKDELLSKIAKLPPKQRKIVELTALGYKQLEICKNFSDTRQNVSYLLKSARKNLLNAGVCP